MRLKGTGRTAIQPGPPNKRGRPKSFASGNSNSGEADRFRYERSISFAVVKVFVLQMAVWLLAPSINLAEPPPEALPPPLPAPSVTKQKLIVGLTLNPPFVIHEPDGSWTGISVELWQEVAKEIGLNYEYRETDFRGQFEGLANGWLDAAVGPLTITPAREQMCDFTHAYYVSSLGAAILKNGAGSENQIFNPAFLRFLWSVTQVALALLVALAGVAILIWLCERKINPTQFSGQGHPVRGLGASLWWAAVTTAGVGYGDLVPRTLLGRAVAIVWMFVSLVLVSAFTATMASTLTAERLSAISIRGIDDLRHFRIGAAENTSGAYLLEANHIRFTKIPFGQLVDSVRRGKVQVAISDEPLLRYAARNQPEITVLSLQLDAELYGFALREGSQLREPINRVLLQKIHEPAWTNLIGKYLPISE
jgi:polar amino acid transport system substrate-binding protein